MGGAESGALVSKEFFDIENQRNFLANMESVNPNNALSVEDKLLSKSSGVTRYVLMTKGSTGTVSCWQTKHIFVCSWVVNKDLPIAQFQFVKHQFQGMDFISINLDACTFDYMNYFMELSYFFLNKDEFLKTIVDLAIDSDPLLNKYISSPFVAPVTDKPIFACATPDAYEIEEDEEIRSQAMERNIANPSNDIALQSSAADIESESGASGSSKAIPHPFIPELEDLQISDTESSVLMPISEYSERSRDYNINAGQSSSFAGAISEDSGNSEFSGVFVNGNHYQRRKNATSRSINREMLENSGTESSSSHKRSSSRQQRSNIQNDTSESATMSGTLPDSETGSRASRRRHRAQEETQGSSQRSSSRQMRKPAEDEPLDFSDGPHMAPVSEGSASDSIILDEPSEGPVSEEYSSSHKKVKSSSNKPTEKATATSAKRRPVVLVPQEQNPNDDLILSDSTDSRSSRRKRDPPSRRNRNVEDNSSQSSGLNISVSSHSSDRRRRDKYVGRTKDQVPMSSDIGIADEQSRTKVSSKDFGSKAQGSNTRISSHTGDTKPISGYTTKTKQTGPLASGSTNPRSQDFENFLGTGSSTSDAHRAIRVDDSGQVSTTSGDYSRTDSRMKSNTSDFNSEKFKPFQDGKQQMAKNSSTATDSTYSRSSKRSRSKRFDSTPNDPDQDSQTFSD